MANTIKKGAIAILKIILFFILIIIILVILIPLKIEIKYLSYDESKKSTINKIIDKNRNENYLIIYIFSIIPLPKIKLQVKKNIKRLEKNGTLKNIINTIFSLFMELIGMQKINEALLSRKEAKKINNSIYIKKLDMLLGINLYNTVVNCYIIAGINALFSILLALKKDMIDYKNVRYDTYISNAIYNFKIYCILKFNLANTIFVIIKVLIRLRKVERKNGKRSTSNRGLDDDCYDIS